MTKRVGTLATRERNGSGADPRSNQADRLLIHACCAPCATVPVERLVEQPRPALFFYNPNIHPRAEYDRRREALARLCLASGVELIEGPYDPGAWERAVAPFADQPEGSHTQRCKACYRLRLVATARAARERGLGRLCTTLTLSRHKNSGVLARLGLEVADEVGVVYQHEDFKKRGGEVLAARRSRELGLYRQDYCGCRLSLAERRRCAGVVGT